MNYLAKIVFILLTLCTGLYSCSSLTSFKGVQSEIVFVIENKTKRQIIDDLTSSVNALGYYKFDETKNEIIFETYPNPESAKYYFNSNSIPVYRMTFQFKKEDTAIKVLARVDYISTLQKYEKNLNSERIGEAVKNILDEIKYNSREILTKKDASQYFSIESVLAKHIASNIVIESVHNTNRINKESRFNFVRKIKFPSADTSRQFKVLINVRDELEIFCQAQNGVFYDYRDDQFNANDKRKVSSRVRESFILASDAHAFGYKQCKKNNTILWRILIQPRYIKSRIPSNRLMSDYFIYVFVLKS